MADETKNVDTDKNNNMAQVKAKEEVEKLIEKLNRINQDIKTFESREPIDLNRLEKLKNNQKECIKKLEELGVHYNTNKDDIPDKGKGSQNGSEARQNEGDEKEELDDKKEEHKKEGDMPVKLEEQEVNGKEKAHGEECKGKQEDVEQEEPKDEKIDGRTIKPLSFWEGRAGVIILPRQENAEMTMADFVNKMNDPNTVTIIKEIGKLDSFARNFNGGEGTESISASQIWNGAKNSEDTVLQMMNSNNGKLPLDNIDSDDCVLIGRPPNTILQDAEHNGKFTKGDLIKQEIMEKLPPEVAKECELLTLEEMKTKYENEMKQEEVKDENNEEIPDENGEENEELPFIKSIGKNVTPEALNGVRIVIANSLEQGPGPEENEHDKKEDIREIIPPYTT